MGLLRRLFRSPADPRSDYEFSTDWFTGNIYLFERNLSHLRNTPCRVLEIGSYEGRSTIWMLDHLATHPAARIDCVDRTPKAAFYSNIEKADQSKKITLHRGTSADVVGGFGPSQFDFIYVDGSHLKADVLEDAVLSFRAARRGAIIAFDDYTEDGPDWNEHDFAKPAIDAFLDIYADRLDLLERSHQVWIRKRDGEPAG